ncbi:MAG: acetyltransferase, partial [Neisseria sp.]|nr:acetyltransferase [Neisseria sp.]
KVVLDCAVLMQKWTEIILLDDAADGTGDLFGYKIIGKTDLIGTHILPDEYETAIAIGNNRVRLQWFKRLSDLGFSQPNIVHPSAVISPFAQIGAANVVLANAVIQAAASVGNACIINTAAGVEHDCHLADGVHLSPKAHLAGTCRVGECSWLGIGSLTRQGINIEQNNIIGAGAVVLNDTADGITLVGVPAKPINK